MLGTFLHALVPVPGTGVRWSMDLGEVFEEFFFVQATELNNRVCTLEGSSSTAALTIPPTECIEGE